MYYTTLEINKYSKYIFALVIRWW